MTSIFTILCPHGIVLSADSAATKRNPINNEVESIETNFQKIYCISKTNFGVSCWGLGKINGKTILDFLAEFEESHVEKTDTIDDVAKKLVGFLQKEFSGSTDRMGMHLVGYMIIEGKAVPQLRHIFHEEWHKAGEFVNENSHVESRMKEGRFEFAVYRPYPPLFNGDNAIANCLINYIPQMTCGKQRIEPASLKLDECIDLADLIVSVSIQRLNYYVDPYYRNVEKTVGGEVTIAKITQAKGFEWVKSQD